MFVPGGVGAVWVVWNAYSLGSHLSAQQELLRLFRIQLTTWVSLLCHMVLSMVGTASLFGTTEDCNHTSSSFSKGSSLILSFDRTSSVNATGITFQHVHIVCFSKSSLRLILESINFVINFIVRRIPVHQLSQPACVSFSQTWGRMVSTSYFFVVGFTVLLHAMKRGWIWSSKDIRLP